MNGRWDFNQVLNITAHIITLILIQERKDDCGVEQSLKVYRDGENYFIS